MARLLVHARDVDTLTMAQIEAIATHPAIEGLVAIMPDCHIGAGCVIGFTGRFRDAVIPNVVGVDIGCGVIMSPLEGISRRDGAFRELDSFIRKNIPLGMIHHRTSGPLERFASRFPDRARRMGSLAARADEEFYQKCLSKRPRYPAWTQLGTLGGGNHFIEVDEDREGNLFVTVHSGSRHLGYQIAGHFQQVARSLSRKHGNNSVPTGLESLPMDRGGKDYMKWLTVAQEFARHNRFMILDSVLSFYGLRPDGKNTIESVHNFISERDGIVRKGAISAHRGEKVVIPLNMASGVVLGIGKGNPDFNFSSPHGAGRVFSRREMKKRLREGSVSMGSFNQSMEGVFSTSICPDTIDESPMAYRRWEDIRDEVGETIEISAMLRPVYNLKAADEHEKSGRKNASA